MHENSATFCSKVAEFLYVNNRFSIWNYFVLSSIDGSFFVANSY